MKCDKSINSYQQSKQSTSELPKHDCTSTHLPQRHRPMKIALSPPTERERHTQSNHIMGKQSAYQKKQRFPWHFHHCIQCIFNIMGAFFCAQIKILTSVHLCSEKGGITARTWRLQVQFEIAMVHNVAIQPSCKAVAYNDHSVSECKPPGHIGMQLLTLTFHSRRHDIQSTSKAKDG